MQSPTLLLDALFLLLTGTVYTFVGYVTSRRRIGGDAQLAVELFALWWYALGAITLMGVPIRVLAYADMLNLGIMVTYTHLVVLGICVALWALLYYLVYLFTGSRRWLVPISVLYTLVYLWILYLIVAARPESVNVTDWNILLVYANPFPRVTSLILSLIISVPVVLAAGGYATLFFRVKGPTQRYRIGMVSFTIAAWFGSSVIAAALGINQDPTWIAASRLISLLSAVLIYAAYRPPGWVRRRWNVRAMGEPDDAT